MLFELLGFLIEQGKGVVRTTFEDLPDQRTDAPVGTTLALIEQGLTVFSAIHGRLHNAMQQVLEIIHRINGVEVLRYQRPQLDGACKIAPASDIIEAGGDVMLGYGHIALQAEGQPVWFRKIELMSLEKK